MFHDEGLVLVPLSPREAFATEQGPVETVAGRRGDQHSESDKRGEGGDATNRVPDGARRER